MRKVSDRLRSPGSWPLRPLTRGGSPTRGCTPLDFGEGWVTPLASEVSQRMSERASLEARGIVKIIVQE